MVVAGCLMRPLRHAERVTPPPPESGEEGKRERRRASVSVRQLGGALGGGCRG